MSKLVVILMAVTSVIGSSARGVDRDCVVKPHVTTKGVCLRDIGVGVHTASVAVPCLRLDAAGTVCWRKA